MDISSDDIATLRSKNVSDDKILDQIKQYDPTNAADISTLQQKGAKPADIINQYVQYHAANPTVAPSQGNNVGNTLQGAAGWTGLMGEGLAHGLGDALGNASATSKDIGLGNGSLTGGVANAANAVANLSGPYDPATNHLSIAHPLTSATYLPRALMEQLPTIAGYSGASSLGGALASVLGPEAIPIGAAAGAGIYGLSQHLGPDADKIAANAGHQSTTGSDVLSALPVAGLESALDTVGNRYMTGKMAAPVVGAGKDAALQTAGNVVNAGLANAAVGGASNVVNQVGTQPISQFNPSQVGQAAQAAGLIGAGARGVGSTSEMIGNRAFKPYLDDPESTARVAQDMKGDMISGDPNKPADAPGMLKTAATLYPQQAKAALGDILAKAKAAAGPEGTVDTSDHEAQSELANNLLTNLSKGNQLDPGQIANAKANLDPEVSNPIMDLNTVKQLQARLGDPNAPQSSTNTFDMLRMFHALKQYQFHASVMGAMAGGSVGGPVGAVAMGALPFGILGARAAYRGITRAPNTVGDFVSRFGQSDPTAAPVPGPQPISDPRQLLPPPTFTYPKTQTSFADDHGPISSSTTPVPQLPPPSAPQFSYPKTVTGPEDEPGPVSQSGGYNSPIGPDPQLYRGPIGPDPRLYNGPIGPNQPQAVMRALAKAQAAKATPVAPTAPPAATPATEAPTAPADPVGTVRITTPDVDRLAAQAHVLNRAQYQVGVGERSSSKTAAVKAVDNVPLSDADRAIWNANSGASTPAPHPGSLLDNAHNNGDSRQEGEAHIENAIKGMSKAGKSAVRAHLKSYIGAGKRYTFHTAYKYTTPSAERAASRLNAAKVTTKARKKP